MMSIEHERDLLHRNAEAANVHYHKIVAELTRRLAKSREQYNEMVDIAEAYRMQNAELKQMLADVFSMVKRQAG